MSYHVYMLTNSTHSVIYVGFTGDLLYRIRQHKNREIEGFTKRYNVDRLVYCEEYESAYDAITREKQLKAGSRRKKLELIDEFNPKWRGLYPEIAEGELEPMAESPAPFEGEIQNRESAGTS